MCSDPEFSTAPSYHGATGLLHMVAQGGTAAAPATVSTDWGSLLKSNPCLTSVAVGYAVTQKIVNTLRTEA
jgi:hypothetical protein